MKKQLLALCTLISSFAFAQVNISGRVIDETGQGIPGANIIVVGTTKGAVTDANGTFTMEAVEAKASISFSFVGYITQTVVVGDQTTFNIKLEPDIASLGEVIVVGYGTTTSKELTGSVSVVSGKNLTSLNPTRFDQALQGQVAGVQISTASGSPGGAVNIRIRGLTSNGDNNPLVLVDGIPYSTDGLNALNPSDIESVNVLKDASAAIYGVRGANGVVIITTKQGKRNSKSTFEFSGYIGSQETTKKLDLLKGREFADLKNEAFAAGGQTIPFPNVDLGKGTDWQDDIFQTSPIQNYNLSASGGSEKSNYSIGGSYLDQKGIVGGDKASYKRYNARVNFTTELAPKLTLQNVLLFTNETRTTLPENGIASVLYNTINASPAASVRKADGTFTYLEEFNDIINPMAQMANTYNQAKVNKLVGKLELMYKINSQFEATARIGYNYAQVGVKVFNPLVYYGSGKPQNSARSAALIPDSVAIATGVKIPILNNVVETQQTYFNYNFEAYLNYNKVFNQIHNVKATLGLSFLHDQGESMTGIAYNVPFNSNNFADIGAAQGNNLLNNTSSYQYHSRLQSFFARAEYSYQSKYLLSAILRRDGSSNFGKNNRFGYFPSVSLAWVATSEPFFQFDKIEFLKVRASYGVVGNDKIGYYRYRALLGGEGVYSFNDQLVEGIAIGAFGNQDLKWETTAQSNFGADITLLNGKLDITTDYYIKKTRDLLFQPDISAIVGAYSAGSSPPIVNGGDVKNSGFEFLINYRDKIGSDFNYNIGYNFTTIKNEVTALQQGVDFYEFGSFGVGGSSATRMQVGQPMGYFFGYKTDGVYQSAEEIANRGVTQDGAQPGDLRFVDISGDNNINFSNNSDKTFLGSAIPEVMMGLNAGASYKGFDFSVTLYASIGNEILRNYERQQPLANLLSYRINRWTGEGSTNEHPRLTTGTNTNGVLSDYFVEDGSFLRLRNIQLGYSIPENIIRKIGVSKIRFYIAVNNLATFTKYKGYDPDFNSGSALTGGVDQGYYPQARTIMGGFNFNF